MCTNGGILLFTVYDQRCAASLVILAILEIIHVVWIYGTENFFDIFDVTNFFDNLSEMGMDMNKPFRYYTIIFLLSSYLLGQFFYLVTYFYDVSLSLMGHLSVDV